MYEYVTFFLLNRSAVCLLFFVAVRTTLNNHTPSTGSQPPQPSDQQQHNKQ